MSAETTLYNLILSVYKNADSSIPMDMIKLFLEKYPDKINAKINSCEQSPLHLAVSRDLIDLVKLLIEYKADVNQADKGGSTPLITASLINDLDICTILLQNGADINLQNNDGHTALIAAANNYRYNTCKLLLDAGAKINLQTIYGSTALILASKNGYANVCEILVNAGADLSIKDNMRKTAFDYAANTVKSVLQPIQTLSITLGDIVVERKTNSSVTKEQLEKIVECFFVLV